MKNKVLFSGSAPSGMLTIGNYLGAFKQWLRFQHEYDCIFCIVDLHALTTPQDPVRLRERTLDFLALYIACGLDPSISTVFIQSGNPYHTELTWILNGCTNYGELSRMTQFKDKSAKAKSVTAGLLNYPILMAADILIYSTSLVPVGADQRQHVELAREIAQRFNSTYGDTFAVPEAFIPESGARIRNLLEPEKKMDKSDPNPRTYISLIDPPDAIKSKIQKAKTDSIGSYTVNDEDAGITNLLTIYSQLTGRSVQDVVSQYQGRGYAPFKQDLTECIASFLAPIQKRYGDLRSDIGALAKLADDGASKAIERSRSTMEQIRYAVGLYSTSGIT